jgi:hypothetical protein
MPQGSKWRLAVGQTVAARPAGHWMSSIVDAFGSHWVTSWPGHDRALRSLGRLAVPPDAVTLDFKASHGEPDRVPPLLVAISRLTKSNFSTGRASWDTPP